MHLCHRDSFEGVVIHFLWSAFFLEVGVWFFREHSFLLFFLFYRGRVVDAQNVYLRAHPLKFLGLTKKLVQ